MVRGAISSEKSAASCLLIALAALLAATCIRFALAHIAPHLTFVTYFPAILICSLLAGWRYGLGCAVLSGVVAELLFPRPGSTGTFDAGSVASLILFVASSAIIIATADALRRAIRDLDRANDLTQTLNRELQHRVGNMLTVVQALASQSAKGASPQAFVEAFAGRLQALAKAHELLGKRNIETCTLPELVEEACAAFSDGENIIWAGPACELPAVSCVPLVLALHELCTNAVKHGALSRSDGRVEISWAFGERPQRLVIIWQELGGPPVSKPTRKGVGSALLRRQAGISEVELSFNEAGVCCTLSIDGVAPLQAADSEVHPAAPPLTLAST